MPNFMAELFVDFPQKIALVRYPHRILHKVMLKTSVNPLYEGIYLFNSSHLGLIRPQNLNCTYLVHNINHFLTKTEETSDFLKKVLKC